MDAAPDAITTVPCHLAGVTRVCYSPDGSTIYTGGTDCLVRIHNTGLPDSEPGFHDNHTEAVTSLTASRDWLVSASLDNIARLFTCPDDDFEGYVTRSPGVPIRWVQIDQQGERVAVCSDDFLVKIVHAKDTSRVSLLSDNTKAVRSAAWDPSGKYLVTAGCDGKIKIYDTSGSTPVCVKIMEGVIAPSEADAETSVYAAWHPNGNYFAAPLRTNDIGIISTDGWAKSTTFANGHVAPVSELAWSANGKYLASSAGRQILVWNTESRSVVAKHTVSDNVTGLVWSPTANMLAFTAMDGAFHRWAAPVPADMPSPVLSEAAHAKKVDRLLDDGLFGDDDDEDMEEKGEELGDGEEFGDDWIVDDVDGGYAGADDGEDKWTRGRTEVVNVTKAQESFVPGSTTWRSKKRYLAFNMIGVVDATDQETHNVVNVEFHDKSARRGYHFADQSKYTMASLGEQGIVYAAPSEGTSASVVHYRPYDSWASAADWSVSLLPGENALAVAAGGSADGMGAVVVATSSGYVRFFTASGIQRYMWRLGEEVVTMAAGRDDMLIVHREGGTTLDGCQNLRYTLMDLDTFDILQEGRVPLPRKVSLSWVGFGADGAPAMYDSAGLLSVLDRYRRPGQARWVPLLDTTSLAKPGRRETYWPVGISEANLSCVILKGNETEPWFPRPLVQELELRMPLLGGENAAGALEESVARSRVVAAPTNLEAGVATDRQLLQLVQSACKADQLARALDLARMMSSTSTLDAALKLASFYHLPGLQEKIADVKASKSNPSASSRRIFHREREVSPRKDYAERADRKSDAARQFADFAPGGRRRTFGGRSAHAPNTPLDSPGPGSREVVPETPGADDDMDAYANDTFDGAPDTFSTSASALPTLPSLPTTKRRRDDDDDEHTDLPPPPPAFAPRSENTAPKNPFAKKTAGGSNNPFSKPTQATAKPLDSVKSTSFFDRVDVIEANKSKRKGTVTKPTSKGKQMTLNAMRRPAPVTRDSMTETETDGGDTAIDEEDETPIESDVPHGVLEETQVQETLIDEDM